MISHCPKSSEELETKLILNVIVLLLSNEENFRD
jgi:hypothetical protein